MKPLKSPIVLPLLGTLLFILSAQVRANGQAKNSVSQRGGRAVTHMSNSGRINNNAQWSADPTRGWVRAEERHDLSKASAPAKSSLEKNKPNATAKAKAY